MEAIAPGIIVYKESDIITCFMGNLEQLKTASRLETLEPMIDAVLPDGYTLVTPFYESGRLGIASLHFGEFEVMIDWWVNHNQNIRAIAAKLEDTIKLKYKA